MIQDIEDPAWIDRPELGNVLDADPVKIDAAQELIERTARRITEGLGH